MLMTNQVPKSVLCLASYEKGAALIRECKRQGWNVILVTTTSLEHANWPRESIDELFHMPDLSQLDDVIRGVTYLARTRVIDRIIPLDDYDVETAAALREHLCLPGLGSTVARAFRDKLTMRVWARNHGVPVPDFVHLLNYDQIREFMERVPPPWLLKPRSEVSTMGIKQISDPNDLWPLLDGLGDRQSFYLLERYVPGTVYHVDAIVSDGKVIFVEVHQYGRPPLDVYHGGGGFSTHTVRRRSEHAKALTELNQQVINALGMEQGVTHTEFIQGYDDGRWYFLETGARVGGANIAEAVEAATDINLWAEWAKIELAQAEHPYRLPARRCDYAGVIITLARQEHPDTSAYQDPEIVLRLDKPYHAGLVVASPDYDRVQSLLDDYRRRFATDFTAVLPPKDTPSS
jgi:biotin carboxylase